MALRVTEEVEFIAWLLTFDGPDSTERQLDEYSDRNRPGGEERHANLTRIRPSGDYFVYFYQQLMHTCLLGNFGR